MGTAHPDTSRAAPIAMAPITGTYTQTSCEKYEDFLKALGVGFILRKAALASTPVMTISEEGGNWTMVTKTTGKSIVTLEGNTMTTTQNATKAGEKNVVVVRDFNDEGLTYKATCDGVTSTQKFKRD